MITKAFSLFDMKTGIFGTPFFMAHIGQAIRAVQDLGQDLNTTIGRHPADFMLVELGTFDDQTGQSTNLIQHHASVLSLLDQVRPPSPLFDNHVGNGAAAIEPATQA